MFDLNLPELHRIAITRIRTSSHHLKIETGRWACIPAVNMMCHCQTGNQDEEHVLLKCPLSKDLRRTFRINHTSITYLFYHNIEVLAEYFHRIYYCIEHKINTWIYTFISICIRYGHKCIYVNKSIYLWIGLLQNFCQPLHSMKNIKFDRYISADNVL